MKGMAKEIHRGTKARMGFLYFMFLLTTCIWLGIFTWTQRNGGKHDHPQIRQRVFGMDKKGTQGAYTPRLWF